MDCISIHYIVSCIPVNLQNQSETSSLSERKKHGIGEIRTHLRYLSYHHLGVAEKGILESANIFDAIISVKHFDLVLMVSKIKRRVSSKAAENVFLAVAIVEAWMTIFKRATSGKESHILCASSFVFTVVTLPKPRDKKIFQCNKAPKKPQRIKRKKVSTVQSCEIQH